jgi:hypothetical protein
MAIYTDCPRAGCDGEIEYDLVSDSDDVRSWRQAEPKSDRCSEGHELTAEEWEKVMPEADKKAAEWAPSEWWE